MPDTVSDLARRLAANAEAVCRHYLSSGRRAGRYWLAGDVRNTPGRSLYVRLHGPPAGKGAAGKWTDAATGEHGDLLDLIAATQGLREIGDILDEARRFLGLAHTMPQPPSAPIGSPEAARRLFAVSKPIAGTLAEAYLRRRGIHHQHDAALRFHPRCFYRSDDPRQSDRHEAWPALVAAVTDLDGAITGVQRTWLDPAGIGKAPVPTPRRAMGHLLGHAVRFGTVEPAQAQAGVTARGVMIAGEGIETVLSLRRVLPAMPLAAALSAGHLAALLFPPELRRLYIARDDDQPGRWATERLTARAREAGVEAIVLAPSLGGGSQGSSGLGRWKAAGGDFNDDLRQLGAGALAAAIQVQLAPEDVELIRRAPERGARTR